MSAKEKQLPAQAVAEQSVEISRAAEALLDKVIAQTEATRGVIRMTPSGVEFENFEGVQRYAAMLHDAGLGPKPGKDDNRHTMIAKLTAAILLGRQLGMNPELSVTSIYVVNGVANLFGDAPLGICRTHSLWDESGFAEWWEVNGEIMELEPDPAAFKDDLTAAVCSTFRKGAKAPKISRFSMAHAKAAGLLGKNQSLYGTYPQRMLRFRARGYCLRDNFGDALKGIGIRELQDVAAPEVEAPKGPPVGRTSLRKAANGAATVEAPAPEQEPADSPLLSGKQFEDVSLTTTTIAPVVSHATTVLSPQLNPAEQAEIEFNECLSQAETPEEVDRVCKQIEESDCNDDRAWRKRMIASRVAAVERVRGVR